MSEAAGKGGNQAKARAAILKAIETQIATNEPPETRQTYERLLKEGHSPEETLKLITCALIGELAGILKNDASYDHARYAANLRRLPKLPWDKD
jgi:hypothetical protein